MCRERRGVGRFEDEVFGGVDERFFVASVAPPENEDKVWACGIEIFDDGFGEGFPTFPAVRASEVSFDRENVIEEEHALLCPVR